MDLSNFATVVRFICKQLNSSELRVKWSSQSQNKRLQSTVPLGPIETPFVLSTSIRIPNSGCKVRSRWDRLRHVGSKIDETLTILVVAKYGPAGTD